jgi:hypothetical protein
MFLILVSFSSYWVTLRGKLLDSLRVETSSDQTIVPGVLRAEN